MAARVDWQEDENLRDDLVKYVRQNLRRKEILDLVQIKYPMYEWSPRTFTRRLQYFHIQFTDYSVDIDDVREAVEEEMNGPGSLLGYRALHQKIREVHGLSVPRNLVYAMMTEVNPQGLIIYIILFLSKFFITLFIMLFYPTFYVNYLLFCNYSS